MEHSRVATAVLPVISTSRVPRFETREKFWEVEQVDATVEICEGPIDGSNTPRTRVTPHDTEDEARYAAWMLIKKKRRRGWRMVGDSRFAGGGNGNAPAPAVSALALDEYYATAHAQFLPELLRSTAASKLGAFAERMLRDKRPWARKTMLAYIDDGCDRPLHKALVKRLFKLVETAGDDEAMAHFMVAFDRLSHRALIKRVEYTGWDRARQQQTYIEKFELVQDPTLPGRLVQTDRKKKPLESPVFSKATRRYLARRAYRYFRKLGHTDVARYGKAMRLALPLYTDEALASAARLLDAWGLVHALYAWSKVIVRAPNGIHLADKKSLGELVPAPHFPDAWKGVFAELLALATSANSRTVRGWAVAMLRTGYKAELAALTFPAIKQLVMSDHDEPLVLGAELLAALPGLDALPIADWLELLSIENLDVLPGITMLAERLLSPARLTLAQCVDLALAKTAPVARLGLQWAKTKPVTTAADLKTIARLGKAGVVTVRDEGMQWAIGIIAAHPLTTPEHVRDLCDAHHADARKWALAVIETSDRFATTPALWFALTESPYDDVRAFVLRHAKKWRDEAPAATLRHVWTTAVLAVHRGSVAKARVPRQIADRIASHPDEAGTLLPVLGYALRSVRPAERALALGALARAVSGDVALATLTRTLLPELTVSTQVSS